jgi:hypothetical protein
MRCYNALSDCRCVSMEFPGGQQHPQAVFADREGKILSHAYEHDLLGDQAQIMVNDIDNDGGTGKIPLRSPQLEAKTSHGITLSTLLPKSPMPGM